MGRVKEPVRVVAESFPESGRRSGVKPAATASTAIAGSLMAWSLIVKVAFAVVVARAKRVAVTVSDTSVPSRMVSGIATKTFPTAPIWSIRVIYVESEVHERVTPFFESGTVKEVETASLVPEGKLKSAKLRAAMALSAVMTVSPAGAVGQAQSSTRSAKGSHTFNPIFFVIDPTS
jgi:hypothetical protein